jgi:hypothetical protein
MSSNDTNDVVMSNVRCFYLAIVMLTVVRSDMLSGHQCVF